MSKDTIKPLVFRMDDNTKWDIPTMLSWVKDQPELKNYSSAILLLLDATGNTYRVRTIQCNLKNSEAVALLEITKGDFVSLINGK